MISKIKKAKIEATKTRNENVKMACTMILGEIPRLNLPYFEGVSRDEQVTDEELTKIIKGLIKSELMTLGYSGQDENEYVKCLRSFLPEGISRETIVNFIKENVDFSKLKNKMQAISIIKKEFKDVDGNLVKTIIEEEF